MFPPRTQKRLRSHGPWSSPPLSPGNSPNYGGEHTNTGSTITTDGNSDGTQELFLSPPTSMLPVANGGIPPWAQPISPLDSDGPIDLISLSNLTGSPSHIDYAVDRTQPDSPELTIFAGNKRPGALAPTPFSRAPVSQHEGRERESATAWEMPGERDSRCNPVALSWISWAVSSYRSGQTKLPTKRLG
jgi:hypothetical protein